MRTLQDVRRRTCLERGVDLLAVIAQREDDTTELRNLLTCLPETRQSATVAVRLFKSGKKQPLRVAES
jgi:hypothetical protein